MGSGVVFGHLFVALFRFDSLGHHGIVGHEEQRASGNVVEEAAGEERRRLHVHRHGSGGAEIVFECFIVFPDASVGRIDRAGPVVQPIVSEGSGDSALQHERRERGHFGREIVV